MEITKQEIVSVSQFKKSVLDHIQNNDGINTRLELYDTFSQLNKLSLAFKESAEANGLVDLSGLLKWYNAIQSNENYLSLINAANTLMDHLHAGIQSVDSNNCVGLLVLLYLPALQEPEASLSIMPKICHIMSLMDTKQRFEFAFVTQESVQYSGKSKQEKAQLFKILIQLFQQYLTMHLLPHDATPEDKEREASLEAIEAVQSLSIFGKTWLIQLQLMKLIILFRIMSFIMKQ
jgi:hypothetical protein